MASLAAGDRILVTFLGSMNAQRIMSTFWYGVGSITGTPTQAAAFTALHASIIGAGGLRSKYLACCPTSYVGIQIWYQVVRPIRYAAMKIAAASTGAFADTGLTSNLAAVITRRGDLANRHNLSSLHIPIGNTEASLEDGLVSNALGTELLALATSMLLSITTTGTVMTVSPVIDNGPGVADVTPITQAFYQDTVRVMRRRTVRVGI